MKKSGLLIVVTMLASGCGQAPSSVSAEISVTTPMMPAFSLTSSAFAQSELIPEKYSCKGENINPPLVISNVPAKTTSLVLIVHDPDAPRDNGFTHWVLYNFSPDTKVIDENSVPLGAVQGSNGAGELKYLGPCPPSGTHHYYFYLYALDTVLQFDAQPDRNNVEEAMRGHILEKTELMGLFSK